LGGDDATAAVADAAAWAAVAPLIAAAEAEAPAFADAAGLDDAHDPFSEPHPHVFAVGARGAAFATGAAGPAAAVRTSAPSSASTSPTLPSHGIG